MPPHKDCISRVVRTTHTRGPFYGIPRRLHGVTSQQSTSVGSVTQDLPNRCPRLTFLEKARTQDLNDPQKAWTCHYGDQAKKSKIDGQNQSQNLYLKQNFKSILMGQTTTLLLHFVRRSSVVCLCRVHNSNKIGGVKKHRRFRLGLVLFARPQFREHFCPLSSGGSLTTSNLWSPSHTSLRLDFSIVHVLLLAEYLLQTPQQ